MSKSAKSGGGVFFIIGLVFIVIGLNGQRTFLGIGIPFFVIGLGGWMSARRK